MEFGIGCCCKSPFCCGHGDQYEFSTDLGSLTEDPHDVFTSSGVNFTNEFYDKYPTAAEIGGAHTLRATSWVEDENQHCVWKKAVFFTRWYKRTTIYSVGNFGLTQTLNITDIPWDAIGSQNINPYSGGNTRYVQCGSAVWGFQLDLSISEAFARIELQRSVARHVHSTAPASFGDPNQSPSDVYDFCDNNTANDYVGNVAPTKSRPAVGGYNRCGVMYQPGGHVIAKWAVANPCNLPFPWTLSKIYDSGDYPALDVPRVFPNTIEIAEVN